MKIIIARHGQTDANKMNILAGQTFNLPLNNEGKRQAEQTRDKLAHEEIDVIISSPLARALETAEIINQKHHVELITSPDIIERNFGSYEGEKMTDEDYHAFRLWNLNVHIPNGESLHDFVARIHTYLEKIEKEYADKKCILIVAHGFVFRATKWFFEGLPQDDTEIQTVNNCETAVYQL